MFQGRPGLYPPEQIQSHCPVPNSTASTRKQSIEPLLRTHAPVKMESTYQLAISILTVLLVLAGSYFAYDQGYMDPLIEKLG